MALSISVAVPVYLMGAFAGFTQAAKICGVESGKGPSNRPDSITQDLFPPSTVCGWNDGTSVDLVPSWIGPVLFVCAAAAVVCAAMALRAAVKQKKELVHD
ncbi:hypothetical protein [Streptomyces sp. NPDC126933]|uniref:hypothetical protein n=1 Tax=unclassified Streptomyces TaxID=2593676 RepID=UPI00365C9F42